MEEPRGGVPPSCCVVIVDLGVAHVACSHNIQPEDCLDPYGPDCASGGGHDMCQRRKGVCCFPTGLCAPETLSGACRNAGGRFYRGRTCEDLSHGGDRPCDDHLRPCCRNGLCWMRSNWSCHLMAGELMPGDSCSNIICPDIPCCLPNFVCRELSPEECFIREGFPGTLGLRCNENPCPPPPDPVCCLCDHQCATMTRELCAENNGVTMEEGQDTCTPGLCDAEHVVPPCGSARFELGRNVWLNLNEHIPVSIDRLNPDDLGSIEDNNCRIYRGNMSARIGPWTCGNFDADVEFGKKNYLLYVVFPSELDQDAHFVAYYRQTCPEYS